MPSTRQAISSNYAQKDAPSIYNNFGNEMVLEEDSEPLNSSVSNTDTDVRQNKLLKLPKEKSSV